VSRPGTSDSVILNIILREEEELGWIEGKEPLAWLTSAARGSGYHGNKSSLMPASSKF